MLEIGPIGTRLRNIARIAVLRGGGLGDLLLAEPAIRSLADTYPDAEIVLLGTPEHHELLTGRPSPVQEVRVLPVARGVYEPRGAPEDALELKRFFRNQAFDLAVQLHGDGRRSNLFLRRLGAVWTVGSRTPEAAELSRWLPFQRCQHETMRALEVVGLVGARPTAVEPHVALAPKDLAEAGPALAGLARPVLTVHPGASDPRRRWPASRFVDVMSAVADQASIVVVGTSTESDDVVDLMRDRGIAVRSLVGELSLSGMLGVLRLSRIVLANDSGPRRLAQAVGTPTVSVYWLGDLINASPLGRGLHRTHISWTTQCPVCGAPCTREDLPGCEHNVSFVTDVPVDDVLADVTELLGEPARGLVAARM
jgi:ADP-heptose:LPS heptosyltransferase